MWDSLSMLTVEKRKITSFWTRRYQLQGELLTLEQQVRVWYSTTLRGTAKDFRCSAMLLTIKASTVLNKLIKFSEEVILLVWLDNLVTLKQVSSPLLPVKYNYCLHVCTCCPKFTLDLRTQRLDLEKGI